MLFVVIMSLFPVSCDIEITPLTPPSKKVFLLYSAGHNNLSSELKEDIKDLTQNLSYTGNNTLLIYTHRAANSSYSPSPSYLLRAYKGTDDIVLDTLIKFPETTMSASAETVTKVLTHVKENFPADEYGLLFSSHCTGYLPAGYYSNSSKYENSYGKSPRTIHRSIGQETEGKNSYEMDLRDFADAIPFKLNYIIFDACLVGGAEVAFQLKEKADFLVASPAEILSEGMDYKTMTSHLFSYSSLPSRLRDFCRNYYDCYNAHSGAYRSATISLINLRNIESFAEICKVLFAKYRQELDTIDPDSIQQYYTYNYHWFYDLCDIVEHLGCTGEELASFYEAFDKCVIYKAATDTFLCDTPNDPYPGFVINNFGGLSMYLPCNGGAYLSDYYKSLDWNAATELVK